MHANSQCIYISCHMMESWDDFMQTVMIFCFKFKTFKITFWVGFA